MIYICEREQQHNKHGCWLWDWCNNTFQFTVVIFVIKLHHLAVIVCNMRTAVAVIVTNIGFAWEQTLLSQQKVFTVKKKKEY